MTDDKTTRWAALDPTPGDALEELAELGFSIGGRRHDAGAPRNEMASRPARKDAKNR